MKKVSIPLIAVLIIAGILFANKEEVKQWFSPEANLCEVCDSDCPCPDSDCECGDGCECPTCNEV